MFNYSEGFPLIENRPTAGLLRLNAYTPAQVLAEYDGDDLEFLDAKKLTDPLSYTRGDVKKTETYNQFFAIQQALGVMEGNLTGLSDQFLGITNEPLKGAALRQLVGKAPLTPWRFSDDELTEQALTQDRNDLNILLEAEQNKDLSGIPVEQLTDNQKQIRQITSKLAYAEAQKKASEKLGFNLVDLIQAQDIFGLTMLDRDLAGDTKDIEERLSRFDPNFEPQSWFAAKFSDDIVNRALLENGITEDLILDAPNADQAMMRIMQKMTTTDLQRRAATYEPSALDKARLIRDTIASGVINSPDTIPSVVAELGLAAVGSLVGPVGTVVGGAVGSVLTTALGGTSTFMRLKKAYDSAETALTVTKYSIETLYKMPIGIMPSYVKNFGLLRGTASSFGFGVVQGGLAEYARQQREIAFGVSTLYANPNAMTDYNMSLIASSAVESGAIFGGVFGLGGGLLRTGVGAGLNRISGVIVDPEKGIRLASEKRWSIAGTPLGNTIDNIKNRFEKPIIDSPVPEKLTKESIINNTDLTPEKVTSETEARVDRVETREALDSVTAARGTPDDVGTRRYESETVPEYLSRVAPNRVIRNLAEILTELARRTPSEGSARKLASADTFAQMSINDQMRVIFAAKAQLEEAKKIETEAVGLPRERERLYAELESQRKGLFQRLRKKLDQTTYKSLMAELEGKKKRTAKGLPQLLEEARNTSLPFNLRKQATDEAALELLEAIQSAATSPDREAKIKSEVSPEVLATLETAIDEHKLTGTLSKETVDDIRRNISGVVPATKQGLLSALSERIANANLISKFDRERVRKIKALMEDVSLFPELVDGNKVNAEKFYDFVTEGVFNGFYSAAERDIILASTVHLNFDSKAFNIEFVYDRILNKDGTVDTKTVGAFDPKDNTITMNTEWNGKHRRDEATRTRSLSLLHEIGHAYFRHNTSAGDYISALKMFNRINLENNEAFSRLSLGITKDPLLDDGFLNEYHLQNVEEVFVQTFSKILFTEGEAAYASFNPYQSSILKSILKKITDSLILAASMFDNSSYYKTAKDLIDSITSIDKNLESFVSVPKLVRAYTDALELDNVESFNTAITRLYKDYGITKEEFELLTSAKSDPAFVVAFSLVKANKKTLIDSSGLSLPEMVSLAKGYAEYKKAQVGSMFVKVGFLIGTTEYNEVRKLNKLERIEYVKNNLFIPDISSMKMAGYTKKILPPTYEDNYMRSNYKAGMWSTTGTDLIEFVASQPQTNETALLLEALRNNQYITDSPIDILSRYLDTAGLADIATLAKAANHKLFMERFKESKELFLNVDYPMWDSKDSAITNLAMIIKDEDTEAVVPVLLSNLNPLIFNSLITKFGDDQEKLLKAVIALFEKNSVELNPVTKKWDLKALKKPEVKAATPEAEAQAASENSMALTVDNFHDMLTRAVQEEPHLQNAVAKFIVNNKAVLAAIQSGKLSTYKQLKKYLQRALTNIERDEKKGKAKERSLEAGTTDGATVTQEGERIVSKEDPLRVYETKDALLEVSLKWNDLMDGKLLTPKEADFVAQRLKVDSDAELAKQLKLTTRTINKRYNKIVAKITTFVKETGIDYGFTTLQIEDAISLYKKKLEAAVTTGTKKTKKLKETVKEVEQQPAKPNKQEGVSVLIASQAIEQRRKNNNAPKVVVPVSEVQPNTKYRVSADVTKNEKEVALRPEEQADAIIAGSDVATKEAVVFAPKKPLKMQINHSDIEPAKLASAIKAADRIGADALVFTDGVIVPVTKQELPVIGKVEVSKESDKPVEAVVEKVADKPVTKVKTKKKRTGKKEDSPVTVTKITVAGNAIESVAQPIERKAPEQVKTTEAEKLERHVNEDRDLLRRSGMDSSFLRKFTKKYWDSSIEAEGPTPLTEGFKRMWSHFVNVNSYIADANRRVLGEEVMTRFWSAVDRINMNEVIHTKVTQGPNGKKPLTYRQVLEAAAKEVSVAGKPEFVLPLLPEDIKFVKADEAGNYRLSARSRKAQAIIELAGEDPVIPAPPKDLVVIQDIPQKTTEKVAPVKPEEPTKKSEVIGEILKQSQSSGSHLLRQNNLVGQMFGGNQRESITWWENLMNKASGATQSSSELGNTIRSISDKLRFVTTFFDDTRTRLDHLVGAGKQAFKTAVQLRNEEGRLMIRIFREYARMHSYIPRATDDVKARLDMYLYNTMRQGKQPNKAEIEALGIPTYKSSLVMKQALVVIRAVQIANKNILDLETSTGRFNTVDSNGLPLDPKTYVAVQLDHEGLRQLTPQKYSELIRDLVVARTKRKLADPTLDQNTIIALGWLDVEYDPKSNSPVIFAPDRTFKASEGANMFSNDTLTKLKYGEISKLGIEGNKADILRMLKIADPENYFIIESDTKYSIYKMPKLVTDLAPLDKDRYIDAINGNVDVYSTKWRTKLQGKNLIAAEIEELLKFKMKKYPYNQTSGIDSIYSKPIFKLDPEGKTGISIRGLTPDEMMETDLTKSILRTNFAEAYFYFLKGRYFELAFQNEINRLTNRTDITIMDILNHVEGSAVKDMETLAEKFKWTQEELDTATRQINSGVKRLVEEYQFNADTLPYLKDEAGYTARIGLAALRFKFSPGYGISAATETIIEIAKQSPDMFTIPKNLILAIRYAIGDYRASKRKLLESDIGDMVFVLENFKTDLANRFMGEIGYGAFRSDSRLSTRVADSVNNIRNASGFIETSTRTLEEASKVMQSLGSLQAVTNATRAMAKSRLQRMIWKYVNNGKLEKLIDELSETMTAKELEDLKQKAVTSKKAEADLWKKFASIARHKAKFGDPNEAQLFMKYGLSTKEQVRHLKWVMGKVKHTKGRVDIINLADIHEDVKVNPVPGIDPDILGSAISAYGTMVEDLIIKTATSELKGLNKVTSLDSRSAFGRMFYALTSWVRAYQDNVILDFGSRSTMKYLASGIFLYAAIDSIVALFKEWLAGRETEDIAEEFENQPTQFVLRGMSRIPFLGIANGLIESGISGISAMTGGSYQYYGVPLLPAGAGASMGAVEGIYRNLTDVASDAVLNGEVNVKALSGLFGAETLINRSPVAIPARVLETAGAFKEMEAIQKYLELVHRKPYPYMDKASSRFKPVGIESQPEPRNLQLERQVALKAQEEQRQKLSAIRPPMSGINDQKGVSGALGDILGRAE